MRPIERIANQRSRDRQRQLFPWVVLICLAALAAYVWVNMERHRKVPATEAEAAERQIITGAGSP